MKAKILIFLFFNLLAIETLKGLVYTIKNDTDQIIPAKNLYFKPTQMPASLQCETILNNPTDIQPKTEITITPPVWCRYQLEEVGGTIQGQQITLNIMPPAMYIDRSTDFKIIVSKSGDYIKGVLYSGATKIGDLVNPKEDADKLAANQVASQKAAADKAIADKVAADKAAKDKVIIDKLNARFPTPPISTNIHADASNSVWAVSQDKNWTTLHEALQACQMDPNFYYKAQQMWVNVNQKKDPTFNINYIASGSTPLDVANQYCRDFVRYLTDGGGKTTSELLEISTRTTPIISTNFQADAAKYKWALNKEKNSSNLHWALANCRATNDASGGGINNLALAYQIVNTAITNADPTFDINFVDLNNRTALDVANESCSDFDPEINKFLIDKGAKMYIQLKIPPEILSTLKTPTTQPKVSADFKTDLENAVWATAQDGNLSTLHQAIQNCSKDPKYYDIAKSIIINAINNKDLSFNINFPDATGQTPLDYANQYCKNLSATLRYLGAKTQAEMDALFPPSASIDAIFKGGTANLCPGLPKPNIGAYKSPNGFLDAAMNFFKYCPQKNSTLQKAFCDFVKKDKPNDDFYFAKPNQAIKQTPELKAYIDNYRDLCSDSRPSSLIFPGYGLPGLKPGYLWSGTKDQVNCDLGTYFKLDNPVRIINPATGSGEYAPPCYCPAMDAYTVNPGIQAQQERYNVALQKIPNYRQASPVSPMEKLQQQQAKYLKPFAQTIDDNGITYSHWSCISSSTPLQTCAKCPCPAPNYGFCQINGQYCTCPIDSIPTRTAKVTLKAAIKNIFEGGAIPFYAPILLSEDYLKVNFKNPPNKKDPNDIFNRFNAMYKARALDENDYQYLLTLFCNAISDYNIDKKKLTPANIKFLNDYCPKGSSGVSPYNYGAAINAIFNGGSIDLPFANNIKSDFKYPPLDNGNDIMARFLKLLKPISNSPFIIGDGPACCSINPGTQPCPKDKIITDCGNIDATKNLTRLFCDKAYATNGIDLKQINDKTANMFLSTFNTLCPKPPSVAAPEKDYKSLVDLFFVKESAFAPTALQRAGQFVGMDGIAKETTGNYTNRVVNNYKNLVNKLITSDAKQGGIDKLKMNPIFCDKFQNLINSSPKDIDVRLLSDDNKGFILMTCPNIKIPLPFEDADCDLAPYMRLPEDLKKIKDFNDQFKAAIEATIAKIKSWSDRLTEFGNLTKELQFSDKAMLDKYNSSPSSKTGTINYQPFSDFYLTQLSKMTPAQINALPKGTLVEENIKKKVLAAMCKSNCGQQMYDYFTSINNLQDQLAKIMTSMNSFSASFSPAPERKIMPATTTDGKPFSYSGKPFNINLVSNWDPTYLSADKQGQFLNFVVNKIKGCSANISFVGGSIKMQALELQANIKQGLVQPPTPDILETVTKTVATVALSLGLALGVKKAVPLLILMQVIPGPDNLLNAVINLFATAITNEILDDVQNAKDSKKNFQELQAQLNSGETDWEKTKAVFKFGSIYVRMIPIVGLTAGTVYQIVKSCRDQGGKSCWNSVDDVLTNAGLKFLCCVFSGKKGLVCKIAGREVKDCGLPEALINSFKDEATGIGEDWDDVVKRYQSGDSGIATLLVMKTALRSIIILPVIAKFIYNALTGICSMIGSLSTGGPFDCKDYLKEYLNFNGLVMVEAQIYNSLPAEFRAKIEDWGKNAGLSIYEQSGVKGVVDSLRTLGMFK